MQRSFQLFQKTSPLFRLSSSIRPFSSDFRIMSMGSLSIEEELTHSIPSLTVSEQPLTQQIDVTDLSQVTQEISTDAGLTLNVSQVVVETEEEAEKSEFVAEKTGVISPYKQKNEEECMSNDVKRWLVNEGLKTAWAKYTSADTYLQTMQSLENAYSLTPVAYLDDSFAKIEQERVFKRAWVAVGLYDEVRHHGDAISTVLGKTPLLITNHKGTLHAFYNVCRHRGSTLLSPGTYQNASVIKCPYHCWTYDGKGKLLGTPYFNDARMPLNKKQRQDRQTHTVNPCCAGEDFTKVNFDKREFNLFPVGVKTFMSLVFVNLNPDQEEAEELWQYQMGDLPEKYGHFPFQEMRCVKSVDYQIRANWKLIAENFVEYYHLPWVHPELCEVSSVANHVSLQGRGQYLGFGTRPLTEGGTPADPYKFPHFHGLQDIDHKSAYFLHVFPNLSLFVFPHHIVSLITSPTRDPGVSKERMTMVMRGDVDVNDGKVQKEIDRLAEFWAMVNDQDIDACERCQTGMDCDVFDGGMMSGKFEKPTHRFQNILIDYMIGNQMKQYPENYPN